MRAPCACSPKRDPEAERGGDKARSGGCCHGALPVGPGFRADAAQLPCCASVRRCACVVGAGWQGYHNRPLLTALNSTVCEHRSAADAALWSAGTSF